MSSPKTIKSKDGRIEVDFNNIENVCMCGSNYALLQYLLLMNEEVLKEKTCYMVGHAINKSISAKLPAYYFNAMPTGTIWNPKRWVYKIWLRLTRNYKYPFLNSCKLYSQDGSFISPLIGNSDYSLLSDGPNCMSQNMQETSGEYLRQVRKNKTITGRLEGLLHGNVAINRFGNNDQCKEFYMTEENTSVAFKDKPVHIKSLEDMWDESTDEKRAFIKYVFDVGDEDIAMLGGKRYMFLTQPMLKDRILNEQEYVDVLKKIFANYDTSQMLLKLHPRDNFDYAKYFPNIQVYSKIVNMQLLVLIGTSIERAITICSSSINAFPETVEVDWWGADIHPKVKKYFGETALPNRKYNVM